MFDIGTVCFNCPKGRGVTPIERSSTYSPFLSNSTKSLVTGRNYDKFWPINLFPIAFEFEKWFLRFDSDDFFFYLNAKIVYNRRKFLVKI